MKKLTMALLLILMLVLSLCFLSWSGLIRISPSWSYSVNFPHLKSLWLNRQANTQLKAQNYTTAFDSYIKTLEFDPFSAETHLDLGLTYEGQKQPEKAAPSYENALKYAKNDDVKFMAYFNQAQLLGKEKKVDEALALYQKALGVEPASKETKHNIELLIQLQQQDQKGGGDDKKDQKDQKDQDKNQQDKQDQKDNQDQKKDQKDNKDQKQDDKDGKDKKKESPRQYGQNPKQQPRPFKGQELSEGDVKKILGEIKQQEQKIRSEYNRKEVKEQPRDKDW